LCVRLTVERPWWRHDGPISKDPGSIAGVLCWASQPGVLVIFLVGGFSGRFGGYGYGYGHGGIGVIGIILIVLVVLLLMGRL
jgi:hypothetical protein